MVNNEKWICCPVCTHKLFKTTEKSINVEIKCTACKHIISIRPTKHIEESPYIDEPDII